jgi:hypothetical protein
LLFCRLVSLEIKVPASSGTGQKCVPHLNFHVSIAGRFTAELLKRVFAVDPSQFFLEPLVFGGELLVLVQELLAILDECLHFFEDFVCAVCCHALIVTNRHNIGL